MGAKRTHTASATALRQRAELMDRQANALWSLALDCDRWGLVSDGGSARRASRNAAVRALVLAAEASALESRAGDAAR